uniref:EF-hand domain-containing protein n=1 Tax=Alexandrium andersonii TaxID=327968 RepID=A0A7S2AQ86_9DINO
MWRPANIRAVLCVLLAALHGGCAAAAADRSLLPASVGQLALVAALVGNSRAEDEPEDDAGEPDEGEDGEDMEPPEEGEDSDPEQIMEDLDENKDGFLTFEEFMQPGTDATEEDKESLKRIMAKVDADGDGKISKEEIPALMMEFDKEYEAEKKEL